MRRDMLFVLLAGAMIAKLPAAARAVELHVAVTGRDTNPGTAQAPLRTIQRAADLAQPGDTVTVHAGLYRERVNPPRGGTSETRRIVYRAAPGEKAEIRGSEPVRGWRRVRGDVWSATVPNSLFGAFNPYTDLIRGDWFDPRGREHHTGAVHVNGKWLIEAASLDDVTAPPGTNPAWLQQSGDPYLVNVAWFRPSGAAGRVPAAVMSAKGGTQNAPCEEGGDCVGFIRHGDWLRYDGVDFGAKAGEIEVRAASASEGGIIEIRRGAPDGELLGSCHVPNTGGWQSWASYRVKVKPLSGRAALCLAFRAAPRSALNAPLWFARVQGGSTTFWAQFPGADPNKQLVEVNVRRTVFYPDQPGRDFITVRGFTMRHAATNWAPPTAEQVGLIGTHWSRGWIIEDNVVSHSTCSGIALGKHGDRFDNQSANSAEGYVETIRRGLAAGWAKGSIGGHVVRRNEVSFCEQAGIVGSLGAAFCTVEANTIHDIHMRRLFSGAEMAGIKFHGAIDTTIRGNHIYRTCLGLWLDWMAQGTHVTGNAFHHNGMDLFTEVNHGPYVVDNNLFLSPAAFMTCSRGGAFAHNLFAGALNVFPYDGRMTPYHKAHSTEVAGYHDNPRGDDRYYNNIFVQTPDLSQYDDAKLPVAMAGNVYLAGAKPSRHETNPTTPATYGPALSVEGDGDTFTLRLRLDHAWLRAGRTLAETSMLGRATVPNLPFERPDGSPLRLTADILGRPRNAANPAPGPIEALTLRSVALKAR
jgi:alpha-N-arabinofuranosidase